MTRPYDSRYFYMTLRKGGFLQITDLNTEQGSDSSQSETEVRIYMGGEQRVEASLAARRGVRILRGILRELPDGAKIFTDDTFWAIRYPSYGIAIDPYVGVSAGSAKLIEQTLDAWEAETQGAPKSPHWVSRWRNEVSEVA